MKVICDNCGAMYKIPDEKLVKPVNKATCRQCGHRMLIPRPRRGADPDERTLVTAVPPTPPPAPSRSDSGPPTTPIHEVEEKTAPTGGRRTEETRWVRNELPSGRPSVQISGRSSGPSVAATERVPAHTSTPRPQADPQARNAFDEEDAATQVGPDPTLTYTPRDERAESPPPKPTPTEAPPNPPPRKSKAKAAPDPDLSLDDEADEPATPRRRKSKGKAKAAHDPRGDIGLALFGVMVALAGVTLLGLTSVIDASWSYALVLAGSAIGLTLAVGGGVGAFLVLVTGGRGSRPAWRVASVIIAVILALLLGPLPAGSRAVYDVVSSSLDEFSSQFDDMLASTQQPPIEVAPPPPVDPTPEDAALATDSDATDDTDAPADDDATADAETDEATDEDAGGTSEPATTRSTTRSSTNRSGTNRDSTSRRSSTTRRIGGTSSSGTPSGSSEPDFTEDEELSLPDDLSVLDEDPPPAASAKPDLPTSPPIQAIDIMVKSNTDVKRCFYDYQQAEGSLPSRVDVKFTIKPNGDATDISATQRKLSGTELESCLIRTIRMITFPPSQKGTTLTFPFVFG